MATPYFHSFSFCTLFSFIKKLVQPCGYAGLSGFALQRNSLKCLGLIPHRQLGNERRSLVSMLRCVIRHSHMFLSSIFVLRWWSWYMIEMFFSNDVYFLVDTGKSYGPTTHHIFKIAQSSLYIWTTYIWKEISVIRFCHLCYSLCNKVAYFYFLNSATLCMSLIWPQLKYWRIFLVLLRILSSIL